MEEGTLIALVGLVVSLLGGILIGVWKTAGRVQAALDGIARVEKATAKHSRAIAQLKLRCVDIHGRPEELAEEADA